MVAVEAAWLDALVDAGHRAGARRDADLAGLVADADAAELAARRRGRRQPGGPAGRPAARAARASTPDAARWLHRGLTSQDVVDTALMLGARDARRRGPRRAAARRSARSPTWPRRTGDTPMVGPHADPARRPDHVRAQGRAVADRRPRRVRRPRRRWSSRSRSAARPAPWPPPSSWPAPRPSRCRPSPTSPSTWPTRLGLTPSTPWHTTRSPITRLGDARSRCTDAWGRLANDVLTLSRPEIGELVRGRRRRVVDDAAQGQPGAVGAGPPGRAGGARSSRPRCTWPPPSPSTSAPTAPGTPSGRRCATLLRRTVVAGVADHRAAGRAQGRHRPDGRPRLAAARDDVRAEQRSMADLAGDRRRPATTSAPPTRSSRRRSPAPPASSPRSTDDRAPITAVRLTGAAHRAELPLLVLGPSIGTSAEHAVDRLRRAASPTPSTWSRWDLPGHGHNRAVPDEPFTMAELAAGVLAVVDDVLAERGEPAARSPTPATPSAARSACSCCSTRPTGSTPRSLLCTGAKIGDADDVGRADRRRSARPAPRSLVVRLRRALVRPRLPRARAGDRLRAAARAAGRRRRRATSQVCGALARVRRTRPARRDRDAGAGRRRRPRRRHAARQAAGDRGRRDRTAGSSCSTASPTCRPPRRPTRWPA